MRPAGIITTIMDLRKVKEWWFNIPLLIFQLAFLIIGTAWGKIKWASRRYSWIDLDIYIAFALATAVIPQWWNTPVMVMGVFAVVAMWRNIDWRKVWQAAQVSHVRLVLDRFDSLYEATQGKTEWWNTANFGYPEMEIQSWSPDWNDGKHRYHDPTFEPSDEFIVAMIEYAEKQVGKRYDKAQLFSYGLNFIIWLFCWKWWGKEKLKWLNMRGGLEVCSSGVTACLRWATDKAILEIINKSLDWESHIVPSIEMGDKEKFFKGYDTAMVSPALFVIDKNWKQA